MAKRTATALVSSTFSSLLRTCTSHYTVPIRAGKQIHAQVTTNALLPHVTLQTDLLLMYSRCSMLDDARRVFDDMPHRNMHSWNILISAHVQGSRCLDALRLFVLLVDTGLRPDHFTVPSALKACGAVGDLVMGMVLHGIVVRVGLEEHVVVLGSVLDMYGKCGKVDNAYELFVGMSCRDVVAWNSIVLGFARAGLFEQALGLYGGMICEGKEMDLTVIPSVLSVCAKAGDLRKGKEIHTKVIRSLLFDYDVVVGNSLIDMYGKCGNVDDSHKVFSKMAKRNVVSWTSLISCYGAHGKGRESLQLYEEMIAKGLQPNCITFTSVLASCSHSGLVEQGRIIFESMHRDYGISPEEEHYACMVDLLGRSGNLEEALSLIKTMPMEPSASAWGALLGASMVHKNAEIGEIASQMLFHLEEKNPSNYIAMFSIYDAFKMWEDVCRVRLKMKELGLTKIPGCSWVTVQGRVHSFIQGDVAHRLSSKIYDTLHGLLGTMAFCSDDHG